MHILTFKFYSPKICLCFGVTGKSQTEILTFKYSEKLNKDLTVLKGRGVDKQIRMTYNCPMLFY